MNSAHEQLIARYLAGDESAGQELLSLCKQDNALLEELAKHSAVNRLINFQQNNEGSAIFSAEIVHRLSKVPNNNIAARVSSQLKQKRSNKIYIIIIGVLLAFIAALLINLQIKDKQLQAIAVIDKVAGAISSEKALNPNTLITQGSFELSSGYAEIKLHNGVILILEGPLKMTFNSANDINISYGNLVAKVPDDNNQFTINTPTASFKDTGNEYAISVDQLGNSQLHVLQGNVKAKANNNLPYLNISQHQARNFDSKQQINEIKNNPDKFMRVLPGNSIAAPEYLHWSFDNPQDNNFNCDGPGIDKKCYTAFGKSLKKSADEPTLSNDKDENENTKMGPEIINGQFGNGIYFNGLDTWLETDFAGISGTAPRTVAFWLKVPADFSQNHGYGILSWGLSQNQSAWQISPNPETLDGPIGRIRVGSHQAEVIGTTDIRDNRWHHIAIVMYGGQDVDLSTHVLMYLDGKIEPSSKKSIAKIFTQLEHPHSKPLMMGRNLAFRENVHRQYPYKFFKGYLDEVYIFNSALNQEQINKLMKNNEL